MRHCTDDYPRPRWYWPFADLGDYLAGVLAIPLWVVGRLTDAYQDWVFGPDRPSR